MAFIIFFLLLLKKCEKVEKTGFFRANTQISNLNVLHKGLLMQDWVFRPGKNQCNKKSASKFLFFNEKKKYLMIFDLENLL